MTDVSLQAVPLPTRPRPAPPVVTLLPSVVAPDPPDRRDRHSTRPRWSAFR